jgi:hypothetical protein
MRVRNFTPFAQLVYANEDAQGRQFDILIVKQSYHLTGGFALQQSVEQEPLNFSDTCFGEVNLTSMRYPSDLVPYKPETDVIVIADAFAPGGKPMPEWEVLVQAGPVAQRLQVTGPREWQRRRGKWQLTDPQPVARVPLRHELAFGGECPGPDNSILTDERNPIGRGMVHPDTHPKAQPIPAPQVLAQGAVLSDPFRRQEPAGFGPIPPAWLPRRPLGGTYDDDWLANTWPHWAADYDFAFHNSAARGMKARGFLQGDEMIRLTGLHPEKAEITFQLPADTVIAHLVGKDEQRRMVRLNLDTVYIDILDAAPEDCLIALTWRMAFLDADVEWLEIDSERHANPIRSLTPDKALYPAPHPSELFAAEAPGHERKIANVD